MAEALQPFNVDLFNMINSLDSAKQAFKAKEGKKLVAEVFHKLLSKYHLESRLGVGLLHRHFDLAENEKLVEFNNVSVPWENVRTDDYAGGKVLPSAWLVEDEKLMPYEFYFSPCGKDAPFSFTGLEEFLEELVTTIKEEGLEKMLALRMFPHYKDFTGNLEMTTGRAMINLAPGEVSQLLKKTDVRGPHADNRVSNSSPLI